MTDILRVSGLATDPSPLLTAQAGGLRVADEIAILRPGVAEQRPRFQLEGSKNVSRYARRGWEYEEGSVPIWATDTGAGYQLESTLAQYTGAINPLAAVDSLTQGFVARDNLYVTAARGAQKLVGTAASGVVRAGLPEAANVQPAISGSGSGYANNDLVAYRVCIVRIDDNGVSVRSAPSPPSKLFQNSGAAADILIRATLPQWVDAGDIVEVYRTRVVSSASSIDDATSDIMFLHMSHTVSTSDANNGLADLTDTNNGGNDDIRGAELYTNSTREGILAANYDPPGSVACASWLGCSWWGNVQNPQRVVLTVLRAPGYFSKPSSVTSGVATITVSDAASLYIGQVVSESAAGDTYGTYIASGTRIVDISGTTVTLSQNAVGTNGSVTIYFHDAIAVDSDVYYATSMESINNRRFLGASGGTYYSGIRTVLDSFCEVVCRYSTGSGPANDYYAYVIMDLGQPWTTPLQTPSLVIRKVEPTSTPMVVDAESLTKTGSLAFGGAAAVLWSPVFGDDPGALVDSTYRYTNRAYYSKPDEPESVPLLNNLRFGSDNTRVLAFSPMRTGMIVWTTQGTYRISGSAPQSWRVDLVDPAVRLVRGDCVDSDGTYAYAWTDRGIARADESGVSVSLTDGLIGQELEDHTYRVLTTQDGWGAWCCSWRRAGVVLFGIPSADTQTGGDSSAWVYAYHTVSEGWTRWLVDDAALGAVELASQGQLALSLGSQVYGWHTRLSRAPAPGLVYAGYDEDWSLSVGGMTRTSDTTFTITDAAAGEWQPKVCDWLSATPEGVTQWFRVTSVVNGSGTYTITVDATLPATFGLFSWVAYEGIESVVQWQGLSAGSPGMTMRAGDVRVLEDWSSYVAGFGRDTVRTEIGATTDRVGVDVEVPKDEVIDATPSRTMRVHLGRDVARCAHLYPRWSRCAINLPWRLLGISAKTDAVSERTER